MATKDPTRFMRAALVMSATMLAVTFMWFLQSKFEGADRKAAVGIVHDYRSKSGRSIPDVLTERHPGKEQGFQVHTESSCMQHERVDIDVDELRVHRRHQRPRHSPRQPAAETVLKRLDRPIEK